MNNFPLISVVVPAFNAEEYIVQCIENLLHQTYKNLEIIVVDDGSTDNTAQLTQQFSTVKYIHKKNEGVSVARNTGIDAATGEYIHFMDADDLLNLEFYENMIRAEVETDSEMACCGFIFERFPTQSQRFKDKTLVSTTEDKIWMTNVSNYGACWRYLFKTSFLKENKLYFEEGRISGEDRIFSLQAVYFANKIVSVPDAVYFYKNRKTSVTTSKNLEIVKKRHQDRKYANQFMKEFALKHGFMLDRNQNSQKWQYKMLGLPIVTKKQFHAGKTRWYFLGIPVFQKKEIDK